MKSIDLTQPGGFPLTQDQLGYLQTTYTEALSAMSSIVGDGTVPVIVQGMKSSRLPFPSILTNIADGWLYYNNELIRFISSNYNAFLSGGNIYIVISESSSGLLYNDSVTRNVVNEKTAMVVPLLAPVPEDATHVLLSRLIDYGTAVGKNYRESTWLHIAVATSPGNGTIAGDIYYKKDRMANTLQLRGELITGSPGDFAAWPNVSSLLMGTLGYQPANDVHFIIQTVTAGAMLKDINGTWFNRLNATLQSDGKLFVDWVKTDFGTPIYGMVFNLVVPLD